MIMMAHFRRKRRETSCRDSTRSHNIAVCCTVHDEMAVADGIDKTRNTNEHAVFSHLFRPRTEGFDKILKFRTDQHTKISIQNEACVVQCRMHASSPGEASQTG